MWSRDILNVWTLTQDFFQHLDEVAAKGSAVREVGRRHDQREQARGDQVVKVDENVVWKGDCFRRTFDARTPWQERDRDGDAECHDSNVQPKVGQRLGLDVRQGQVLQKGSSGHGPDFFCEFAAPDFGEQNDVEDDAHDAEVRHASEIERRVSFGSFWSFKIIVAVFDRLASFVISNF